MTRILRLQPGPTSPEYPVQSIEVPGTRKDGQTGHYRHPKWPDLRGELGRITLPEVFESGLAQAADRPFLGHRPRRGSNGQQFADAYVWQTYRDVDRRRNDLGSALEGMFRTGRLRGGADFEGVGIWSINRPEWQIVELGCHLFSKVSIALYDTLGASSVEYVINHAELSIIFCTLNHIDQLLDLSSKCKSIRMIISFDPLDSTSRAKFNEKGMRTGVQVLFLEEVEQLGAQAPMHPVRPTLDTIATICYTSGTTGTPKGAVLTHKNLGAATLDHLHGFTPLPPHFVFFSYLPLAHIFGRGCELMTAALGGSIGYFSGDPLNLLEDVQVLKPHFFPAVPRVLNRIYDGAMALAHAPGLKGFLMRRAVEAKLSNLRSSGSTKHTIWDALVFKKIQAVLGGRIVCIVSGSAPISTPVMDFLKISFGCKVLEGYGLTETCAAGTLTWSDDNGPDVTGLVGGVASCCELKLVDVPALGYSAKDLPRPRGEVCFRGDNVFSRYYNDDQNTRAAIDADGWFHSGDIAEIDAKGRFKIIDRLKNIMKLSQGEYVALEKIEHIYSACAVVSQIYVHGESLKDYLVATVVPEPNVLAEIAAEVGQPFNPASPTELEAAVRSPSITKAVLDAITSQVRATGEVKGFETVKVLHLTLKQFSVENDTLTPTFKLKRRNAYAAHKEAIDKMYALPLAARSKEYT